MIDDYKVRPVVESDYPWIEELVSQKNGYYNGEFDKEAKTYVVIDKTSGDRLGFYQIASVSYLEGLYVDQKFSPIKKAGIFIFVCRFLKEVFDKNNLRAIWLAKIDKKVSIEKGIYGMYKRLGNKINHRKYFVFKNF